MAEPQYLSLDPDEGQPASSVAYLGTDPDEGQPVVPTGSERTRPDTNIIGIDHERLQHGIANWASTLRPEWQRPAAMLATFPADVLASLVELVSAPETLVAPGAKPGMAALDAAVPATGRALNATGRTLETTGRALERPSRYVSAYHLLHSPETAALTYVAPKVATKTGQLMQRAGSALTKEAPTLTVVEEAVLTKQGYTPQMIAQIREQLKAGRSRGAADVAPVPPSAPPPPPPPAPSPQSPSASAPAATASLKGPSQKQLNEEAIARRRAEYQARLGQRSASAPGSPAAPASPTTAPRSSAESGSVRPGPASPKPKLTAPEQKLFLEQLRRGKSYAQAFEAVRLGRELAKRLGGASAEEVRKAVAHRNASGQW